MSVARTREPAVAGLFYPEDAKSLAGEVEALLHEARRKAGRPRPKALIVPHAGYLYSGPIAASAYALLSEHREGFRRVVLAGPCHRVAVRGIAIPSVSHFATPLGVIPIDRAALAKIEGLPQIVISDAAHRDEHALEVQLPFLQRVLDDFSLAPLAVGFASPQEVAEVFDCLWGGEETLIVVSSDLSHYHPYEEARRRDTATVREIERLGLLSDHEQACGATPINGLITVARAKGLVPELLDLRNSGDTSGDRLQVVGYASFAFFEAKDALIHHA
ncbi:MAG: AmmeMemoRadiSam system protein B [Rhodocyclaceae bacterium]|nr:AmmeMemoRadiSam system protein B [Rhodocyclaceae bacterium]